jgi:hypothetical protein
LKLDGLNMERYGMRGMDGMDGMDGIGIEV